MFHLGSHTCIFSLCLKCLIDYSFFKFQSGTISSLIHEGNQSQTSTSFTNRRIMAKGDGGLVNMANMPFRPPLRTWRGRPCLGISQFIHKIRDLEGTPSIDSPSKLRF